MRFLFVEASVRPQRSGPFPIKRDFQGSDFLRTDASTLDNDMCLVPPNPKLLMPITAMIDLYFFGDHADDWIQSRCTCSVDGNADWGIVPKYNMATV
jgi:hypothetical protein